MILVMTLLDNQTEIKSIIRDSTLTHQEFLKSNYHPRVKIL